MKEKLFNIVKDYLNSNINTEVSDTFCNEFMEEFYNVQDALEQEVEWYIYELFDDINVVCDSFEPDVKIRKNDKYCIDEITLQIKIQEIYEKIMA